MAAGMTTVVGQGPPSPDDGLLLPRPPGATRRFWARHPRLADALIAVAAFVFSGPGLVAAAPLDPEWRTVTIAASVAIPASASIALLWRRRHPVVVFAIAAAPYLVAPPPILPSGVALAIAIFSLSVYRSAPASWVAFGGLSAAMIVSGLVRVSLGESWQNAIVTVVATIVMLLIGALVGLNVGSRARYVDALIARSRQLAIERDQQSQLATAAERTRIAREMHDIVAHSLTVIVALSEGSAATSDPERARTAARTTAETARSALHEMRAMLGVLRADDGPGAPLTPVSAPDPHDVVVTAQRAGYPVSLRTSGDAAVRSAAVDFAIGRVVQEGVTNAMRHAPHARWALVEIRDDPDAVRIRISNDGVPVPQGHDTAGFGLRGLEERVTHVNGTLHARRGDGTWLLDVTLPIEETRA